MSVAKRVQPESDQEVDALLIDTPLGLKPQGFSVLRGSLRSLSLKALPKPLYVLRGVVIAMQAGSTVRATMPADG